jgi:Xaa-Pro aminopeptidase
MFSKSTYIQRRKRLAKSIKSGAILLLGNNESPINYEDNTYPFRQDSSFLYFYGLNRPGLAGLIDVDTGKEYIFGEDPTIHSLVWTGAQRSVRALANTCGVKKTGNLNQLHDRVKKIIRSGRKLHSLPPYRAETALKLAHLTGISAHFVKDHASVPLIKAVAAQRIIKSDHEIREIENALNISHEMYMAVLNMVKPGLFERDVRGHIEGIALARGYRPSFQTICTTHGETLHNLNYDHELNRQQMLLIDSGVESPAHYSSDITRTYPVSGKFSSQQAEIYQIVLKAQKTVVASAKPGVTYRSIHLKTAKVIASGLKDLGLMKGDIQSAVKSGAHALFFPHGIGHLLGLDAHDMEDLGEDRLGYDERIKRSSQFGLASLRFAKALNPGIVITVEPGIYFIPRLIETWQNEKKFETHINYDALKNYQTFGGIRIEDNMVITKNGCRVLGKPIPKEIDDIQTIMGG